MDELKKRPYTKKEQEDFFRRYCLAIAWGSKEPVIVDGVTLMLECGVDTSVWRPMCSLGVYDHGSATYGPEVVFPWTPPDWRDAISKEISVIEASEGSIVSVRAVTSAPIQTPFGEFQEAESREMKLAHLVVVHGDGKSYNVRRPLLLLSRSATEILIDVQDYSAAFRGLVSKLEVVMGVSEIEDLLGEPMSEWPKPKDDLPRPYVMAFLAFVQAVKTYDEDAYAAFGYMMAKAEAEAELLQPARRGRQAAAFQARAADGRHLKSRQRTEPLRTIARQIIEGDREISLSRCARLVEDIVKQDPTWTFKSDSKWITGHIRELFEKRGTRLEYRPKRLST